MSRFKLLYFVIFMINLCIVKAQISDKRLCVDKECKVPISLAKTLLRYSSPDSRILSFAPNVDITIYSKSAGSREDLWGGEINGKRGYIPKKYVKETKILAKPTLLVDTEFNNDTGTQQVPSQVEPAKVQEPYEIVDGTTIYLNPQEDISPTSTESPIQTTALPVAETKSDQSKVTLTETVSLDIGATASETNKQEEKSASTPSTDQEVPSEVKTEDSNKVESDKSNEKSKEPESDSKVEESAEEADIEVEDEDEDDDEDEEVEELEAVIEKEDKIENETETVEANKIVPEVKLEVAESQSNASEIEDKKEEIKTDTLNETGTKEIKIETPENATAEDSIRSILTNFFAPQEEVNKTETNEEEKEESAKNEKEENQKEPLEANENKQEVNSSQEDEPKILPPLSDTLEQSKKDEIKTEEVKEQAHTVEIETTTQSAEFEVPQPVFDDFAEVTPNPVEPVTEETQKVEELLPIAPPLGLFNNQNQVDPTSENSSEKQSIPEEEVQEEKKEEIAQQPEEEVTKEEERVDDFSFQEDSPVVTKEKEEEEEKESENKTENKVKGEDENKEEPGFFEGVFSMFSSSGMQDDVEKTEENEKLTSTHVDKREEGDELISITAQERTCDATCQEEKEKQNAPDGMEFFTFNSDVFLYLATTAVSVIIFLFGYIAFDKNKREGPLVARINSLEKELLILVKENQILQEKISGDSGYDTNDRVSSEVVENIKQDLQEMTAKKNALEEQVQLLEKELENSTEVGMELNRMLSEILSSESGSDVLKANVEHLQRQLVEQQATINSINETLAVTNTENHELRLELELSNKKVLDLQAELDKLLLNVLKIEEEKESQQTSLEGEINTYRQKYEEVSLKLRLKEEEYNIELKQLKNRLDQTERNLELKLKEHDILTDTIKQLKAMKSNDGPSLQSLLDSSSLKAEVQQLKAENQRFSERLRQEEEAKTNFEKRALAALDEARILREKYDEADKLRLETETKLDVLSSYFKDREAHLQKEIAKHESLWEEKQGEASSTTERIKFMQEQLQNYKAQTESLKQEIMSQEVELKSQISVLEKKAHENWVSARQAERKLEEAKQEAAQLRHRLTLRERAIHEDKTQHRFQSPIEQNGDMPVSSPIESPASPPLLYGSRDHITKSPPIPGLPPFLPPPPGVPPFMPPPPLPGVVPPFMPPPPSMFPGDHRPPPLGRMSSPPLNSRYSPSSRGYSPYDRNSSSPSDSEYGTSPPQRRGYSPYRGDDRRDYKRAPPGRTNGRSMMKGGSSGSGHSNESLDKVNRSKV